MGRVANGQSTQGRQSPPPWAADGSEAIWPTQGLKLQNDLSPRLIGAGRPSKYQGLRKDIIRFDPAGQRARNDLFWSRKLSA